MSFLRLSGNPTCAPVAADLLLLDSMPISGKSSTALKVAVRSASCSASAPKQQSGASKLWNQCYGEFAPTWSTVSNHASVTFFSSSFEVNYVRKSSID